MSVHPRMQQVLREVFDDDDLVVTDSTTAADVEDWDSLAHVSIIVALEREFGIRFTAAEASEVENVGALRQMIELKLTQ